MAAIRPIDVIARKWATVTPQRAPDYEFGINNPRTDWAEQTRAANDAWKAGVQQAAAQDRFAKGVARAGTSKWQANALSKGVQRWGPGVQLALDDYQTAFAPFVEAFARATLPPRFARRDPRNLERVAATNKIFIDVAKRLEGSAT